MSTHNISYVFKDKSEKKKNNCIDTTLQSRPCMGVWAIWICCSEYVISN